MPLKGGDTLRGILALKVEDEATGETPIDGAFILDMDIDPDQNVVTMTVSTDIGHD